MKPNQKICIKCKIAKSILSFRIRKKTDNDVIFYNQCKSCEAEYSKQRRKNISNQLKEYKKTLKCENCGFDDYRALEFHHVTNTKDFNISDAIRSRLSFNKILTEIEKCQVLCANCHRIYHYLEQAN